MPELRLEHGSYVLLLDPASPGRREYWIGHSILYTQEQALGIAKRVAGQDVRVAI